MYYLLVLPTPSVPSYVLPNPERGYFHRYKTGRRMEGYHDFVQKSNPLELDLQKQIYSLLECISGYPITDVDN